MKKDLVIGMGEILWDVLPEGKKLGGAPCNFAYHVGQFGLPSVAISAIGDDPLGREILATLDDKGVKYNLNTVPYPTGTVQVEIDSDGIPQYDIKENVAWDNIPYTDALEQLAGRARAFCFGSLAQRNVVSRNTINRFLDAMKATGEQPLIVFDINLRQDFFTKDTICKSIERCNVLKINDEELVIVSRLFEYPGIDLKEKCRRILDEFGLKMLILTCGVNGSYVFTPDEISFMPTPKVEVADTVGAGDSFTAAFIASILKGESVTDAHRRAVEVSAYVCTQNGAMPTLPGALTGC